MRDRQRRAHEAWQDTWAALALTPRQDALGALIDAYGEPQRHYHTLDHVLDSLRRFEAVAHLARTPAWARLALWCHDVLYDPRRSDNEARSADWADELVSRSGADPTQRRLVRELILATDHRVGEVEGDAALVCDVDLAILGAAPPRYAVYERDIAAEYSWVPASQFRQARVDVLRAFLDRDTIYRTPPFQRRYELRARHNLGEAMRRLEGGAA